VFFVLYTCRGDVALVEIDGPVVKLELQGKPYHLSFIIYHARMPGHYRTKL